MRQLYKFAIIFAVFSLLIPGLAQADKSPRDVVIDARQIVDDMMTSSDNQVPLGLLKTCGGVIIVPGVVKGGFILGGSYGEGVAVYRNKAKNTWSDPAFMNIGAGSLGFQIGVQSIDLILVVKNRKTLEALISSKVKLGADMAIAAGPVGARAEAATDVVWTAPIYSYSKTKGVFAGVSLEGSVLGVMDEMIRKYYGPKATINGVLFRGQGKSASEIYELRKTLAKYSK